jgi:hypothetical protein
MCTGKESYLLHRAGFGDSQLDLSAQEPYVILTSLVEPSKSNYDPFGWSNPRTFGTAHRHIIENWSQIDHGAVIDVEYILGETKQPKRSEFYETGA